jgi:hypothetical protein
MITSSFPLPIISQFDKCITLIRLTTPGRVDSSWKLMPATLTAGDEKTAVRSPQFKYESHK